MISENTRSYLLNLSMRKNSYTKLRKLSLEEILRKLSIAPSMSKLLKAMRAGKPSAGVYLKQLNQHSPGMYKSLHHHLGTMFSPDLSLKAKRAAFLQGKTLLPQVSKAANTSTQQRASKAALANYRNQVVGSMGDMRKFKGHMLEQVGLPMKF